MAILNLTQHLATPEQIAAGVIDLPAEARDTVVALLTFGELPSRDDIGARANDIAQIAALMSSAEDRDDGSSGFADRAMIGGAPYLMAPLEAALRDVGVTPVYAFSVRKSTEQVQPDGSVRKYNIFRHIGFVPV